ncbi:MAG: recombination mediator RecR [Desulfovibrio sp.]|jgi:recombination protein RecR|nr:recombination mediator RecR [Desulfovibrio sp.]
MQNRMPEPLRALLEQLVRLPGLGPKSAMRLAMTLLKWPESETRRLGLGIHDLRDNLRLCSRCGGLSSAEVCDICADAARVNDTLCLVAEWDSMLTLEEGGFYRGQYMILGGLLDPLEHKNSGSLDIDKLVRRLGEGEVTELILALGATLEAENTASFIRSAVCGRFPKVRVSRLAQGIPLGAEVKYMDRETLRQSLQFRQELVP